MALPNKDVESTSAPPAVDTYAQANERGRAAERNLASQDPVGRTQIQPADNEQLVAGLHQQTLGKPGTIQLGVIVYAIPYLGWYRVNLDQSGEIPCCRASETSFQPFSVLGGSVLPPRTQVIVWIPPYSRWGYILGAVPKVVTDNEKFFPDWISQGSHGGFHVDDYYHKILSLTQERGGTVDWSDGRPLGGTALGEWSRFNSLGGGLFIDPFMLFMRIDETCGLWLHYLDRLARLSGYNLDIRTAISELVVRNDEGEGMSYRGVTPYPWEALAVFDPKTESYRSLDDSDVFYDKPWYGKHEPHDDKLQPFWRYEEFEGYLGQAHMRQVLLPPKDPPERNQIDSTTPRPGVFREQIGLDGSYAVQSAHSITLAKRCLIPVPKQIRVPEDDKGDVGDGTETSSNYKFAGQFGNGAEHKIRTHPDTTGQEHPHLLSAAGQLDEAAYAYNWKGLHPFHYHENDFSLPQEGEVPYFNKLQESPGFSDLKSKPMIDRPEPVSDVRVDDRDGYKSAEYYETTAGISLLPDGGVVIRDGYGGEIMMTGGNIHITCPGDVFVRPGRSFVAWGGDDVVMRAQQSVDISAARKDVRVKAEKNLEVLSGNSGSGRMLLENRASGSDHTDAGKQGEEISDDCGIHLKSRRSEVTATAQNIYLRTGSSDGEVQEGEIVLDASRGSQPVRIVASSIDAHLESDAKFSFPARSPKKRAAYQLAESRCFIPCYTAIDGYLTNSSHFLAHGHLMAAGGHVYTSIDDPYVWNFKSEPPGPTKSEISQIRSELKDETESARSESIEQAWWLSTRIGSPQTQREMEFGFRTPEQYGTSQFIVPEAYWQQLQRISTGHSGGDVWIEPAVEHNNQQTYPHPGKEPWKDQPTMAEVDLQLWDSAAMRDKDRGSDYEEPKMKWAAKKPLDGYYPTINP